MQLPSVKAPSVSEGAVRAGRAAQNSTDEHRCGSGRDRAQGGSKMGLHEEGNPSGRGAHHRLSQQLPRPHHQRRQLLIQPGFELHHQRTTVNLPFVMTLLRRQLRQLIFHREQPLKVT